MSKIIACPPQDFCEYVKKLEAEVAEDVAELASMIAARGYIVEYRKNPEWGGAACGGSVSD